MSDISSVTKYFATPNEGFVSTLGSTILSGATIVPLTTTGTMVDGSIFVGIIEPGQTNQQVFTGTVSVGGSQIINVVWTRGANIAHPGGVSIVDYVTGTAIHMITAGMLVDHAQNGHHSAIVATSIATTGNGSIGGNLSATGTTTLAGAIGGAGYDTKTLSNSYKFSAYDAAGESQTSGTFAKVSLNTKAFDTGSNFDTTNFRFVAPVAGFYYFTARVRIGSGSATKGQAILYKNGSPARNGNQVYGTGFHAPLVSGLLQLAASDYVELWQEFDGVSATIAPGQAETYLDGFLLSKT